MKELSLISPTLPIPVPSVIFQILLLVTFLLHVIMMNLMLGGMLLYTWARLRGTHKTFLAEHHLPTTIALAVNLGVPPLLFVQVLFGNLFYSSSILIAPWWLSIVALLILAYYGAYYMQKKNKISEKIKTVTAISSSILLLTIGFLFVSNNVILLQPQAWQTNQQPIMDNVTHIIPRFLHMVMGGLAIATLALALVALKSKKHESQEQRTNQANTYLRQFAFITMAQVILGIWFLLIHPSNIMWLFIGNSLIHTLLLAGGIILAVLAIITAMRKQLQLSLMVTLLILVTMVVIRTLLRDAYLGPVAHQLDSPVVAQWSPFLLFLVIFLGGIALLIWMIKIAVASSQHNTGGAQ